MYDLEENITQNTVNEEEEDKLRENVTLEDISRLAQ